MFRVHERGGGGQRAAEPGATTRARTEDEAARGGRAAGPATRQPGEKCHGTQPYRLVAVVV